MNQVSLRKKEITGLLRIAAKGEVRYYLNGVFIDFDRKVCVVTDGHMMLVMKPEAISGKGQVIVPREALENAIKLRGKDTGPTGGPDIAITVDGMAIDIAVGDIGITAKAIDGRFPEFERVIPREISGVADYYNADYLALMKRALVEIAGSECWPHMAHNGKGKAGVMFTTTAKNAFGLIMPMHGEANPDAAALDIINNVLPVKKKAPKKKPAKKKAPAKKKPLKKAAKKKKPARARRKKA